MESHRVLCALAVLLAVSFAAPGVLAADPTVGFALDNGDINGDQFRNVTDPVCLLQYLFMGGPAPVPLAYCGDSPPDISNGDTNADGKRDISDVIGLFGWLFLGGVAPAEACPTGGGAGGGNGAAKGVPRVAPPHSNAFGASLAEWFVTYWRRTIGGGNDTVGRVRLLGLPEGEAISGEGTPEDPVTLKGVLDVELPPGTPFVLPQYAWILEKYDPDLGLPDDECIPDDVHLAQVDPIELTIDGMMVISNDNQAEFYTTCTPLHPPVMYDEPTDYGSIGAIAVQGVGFVSPPLPPGDHVIHLYEVWIAPGMFGVIYDNTWNIHVAP